MVKQEKRKDALLKMIPSLRKEIEKLEDEVKACNVEISQADHERAMLKKLFDDGVIDRDGNVINQPFENNIEE